MLIAIVTPTCRENPRTIECSRTLAAALRHAPDVQLAWIIVDEKLRPLEHLIDAKNPQVLEQLEAGRLQPFVVQPLPSKHREPGPNKAPAHNAARSAGLLAAFNEGAEYTVFLNDCNVVTYGILKVLADCAKQGVGYRAKMHDVYDLPIPADGVVKHKDHHDLLRPIPVTSACGALWGAPTKSFADIKGFDLSYDGERYGNDLDCVVRLSRVGVTFVTTERAFVIQMRRTKIAEEITTRKDVTHGERNHRLFNDLQRDTKRTLPLWIAGEPEPLAPAPMVAAPVAAEEPKPKWKKRAPPIVGANLRHAGRGAGKAPIDPARRPAQPAPPAAAAPAVTIPPKAAPPPAGAQDFDLGELGDADNDPLDEFEDDDAVLPEVTKRADGALTVGPPPDGRSVDAHLDELAKPTAKA